MKNESYCDDHEDLFIYNAAKRVLKKDSGFYVDIGANDGVTGSTTYYLEQKGWTGVLVEPNPELHKILQEKRPNSRLQKCLISDQNIDTFYIVKGEGNLHGLSRIEKSEKFSEHVAKHAGDIEEVDVKSMTFHDLLKTENAPAFIDFVSLDVEGHELNVLKTFDFNAYEVFLFCIEDNSKGRSRVIEEYLKERGYVLIARTGVNDWYTLQRYAGHFLTTRVKALMKKSRWRLKYRAQQLMGLKPKNNLV